MYGSDGITALRVFSPLTGDIYKKDEVGRLQYKYEQELHLFFREIAEEEIAAGPELPTY